MCLFHAYYFLLFFLLVNLFELDKCSHHKVNNKHTYTCGQDWTCHVRVWASSECPLCLTTELLQLMALKVVLENQASLVTISACVNFPFQSYK